MALTPYSEKLKEVLGQVPISRRETADGMEFFYNDKTERIALGYFSSNGGTQYGLCCVIPKAEYVLPIFFSRWEERDDSIEMLVDFMPTVDILVDEPYRVKYIEVMGPAWDRFAALPGIRPEEDDELRSVCSIIYTGARIPVDREGMRLAALAPHTAYLKQYVGFVREAAAEARADTVQEVQRKTAAVRNTLKIFGSRWLQDTGRADEICERFF